MQPALGPCIQQERDAVKHVGGVHQLRLSARMAMSVVAQQTESLFSRI